MQQKNAYIFLVGPSGAGKTAILKRLLEYSDFNSQHIPTKHESPIFPIIEPLYTTQIGLCEIPGENNFKNACQAWAPQNKQIYVVCDATQLPTKENITGLLNTAKAIKEAYENSDSLLRIKIDSSANQLSIGLIINKIDLLSKADRRTLSAKISNLFDETILQQIPATNVWYCSAKTNEGIDALKADMLDPEKKERRAHRVIGRFLLNHFSNLNAVKNSFFITLLGLLGIFLLGAFGSALALTIYSGLMITLGVFTIGSMLVTVGSSLITFFTWLSELSKLYAKYIDLKKDPSHPQHSLEYDLNENEFLEQHLRPFMESHQQRRNFFILLLAIFFLARLKCQFKIQNSPLLKVIKTLLLSYRWEIASILAISAIVLFAHFLPATLLTIPILSTAINIVTSSFAAIGFFGIPLTASMLFLTLFTVLVCNRLWKAITTIFADSDQNSFEKMIQEHEIEVAKREQENEEWSKRQEQKKQEESERQAKWEQEEREALPGIQQNAENGDPIAQKKLAEYYYLGKGGLKQDTNQALLWLKKAADNNEGDNYSPFEAAIILNIKEEFSDAQIYMRMAAERGYKSAQLQLYFAYQGGELGLERNEEKARYWYDIYHGTQSNTFNNVLSDPKNDDDQHVPSNKKNNADDENNDGIEGFKCQ
jgi:GTPase SAR1 family protein